MSNIAQIRMIVIALAELCSYLKSRMLISINPKFFTNTKVIAGFQLFNLTYKIYRLLLP